MHKTFIKKYGFYILLAICFLVLFNRSLMGFCWSDESFYISTADRFFRGTPPIKGEWYRTQMSSLVMLPFYSVYRFIAGSAAGSVLFFRILYLILNFSAAVISYRVIKKDYPDHVAALISVFVCFYCHLNVATFSYYMLSLNLLYISLLLVYDYKNSKSRGLLVVSGIIFALAVLCLPTMAVGYIVVALLCLVIFLAGKYISKIPKEVKEKIENLNLSGILWYTFLGILIPFVIFLVYTLSKVSISEIIESIPYILVDNEHDYTLGYYVRKPHNSILEVYGIWTYPAYALCIISLLFGRLIRKKGLSLYVFAADIALFIPLAYYSFGHTGYIQTALMFFSLPLFFVTGGKNHRAFWIFALWGAILAITFSSSSSDFLYVMAIGFALCAVAGIMFIVDFAKELFENGVALPKNRAGDVLPTICKGLIAVVLVYFAVVTIYLRLVNVYRDAPVGMMNAKIESGLAKGLYTTGEHLGHYEDVYEMIERHLSGTGQYAKISESRSGNVLFSKLLPWGYVEAAECCGYPTTWRATAYNADQLEAYYAINPAGKPDVIVVMKEYYGSYLNAGDVDDDMNPNLDEMNDYWKDYIRNNGMTPHEEKCGTIYYRE